MKTNHLTNCNLILKRPDPHKKEKGLKKQEKKMSLFAISSGGGGSTASSSTGSNKQNKNDFPKRSSVKLLASRFAEAISGEEWSIIKIHLCSDSRPLKI